MTSKKIDLKKISEVLREQCPFIVFATISCLEETGRPGRGEKPELNVFILEEKGTWSALEQILQSITPIIPDSSFDLTLLNRVDPATRLRAANGFCLYVLDGKEQYYRQFVRQASLDYRLMRARQRVRGLVDND
jgi:hypothetical protein